MSVSYNHCSKAVVGLTNLKLILTQNLGCLAANQVVHPETKSPLKTMNDLC